MVAPALAALLTIPHLQEGGDMGPAFDTMKFNELSEILVFILMPGTPLAQLVHIHISGGRTSSPLLFYLSHH